MFILILCLLHIVSAQPIYSRTYLRALKRHEIERVQTETINMGITMIENYVFTAAKQGLTQYTTEPVNGCESADIYGPTEFAPFGIDKEACENIVNGIRKLVSERFPDSELLYNANTKQYTLKWD